MPTHTDAVVLASVNSIIASRRIHYGLSWMALARQAGISYHRLITGAALTDSELAALVSVLGPLGAWRELDEAADRIVRTVFAPTTTPATSATGFTPVEPKE